MTHGHTGPWTFLKSAEDVGKELKAQLSSDPPDHYRAAAEQATSQGLDLNAELEKVRENARRQPFPTAECLTPDEVESYWIDNEKLAAPRRGHAADCVFCQRVVAVSEPSQAQMERFISELARVQSANVERTSAEADSDFLSRIQRIASRLKLDTAKVPLQR